MNALLIILKYMCNLKESVECVKAYNGQEAIDIIIADVKTNMFQHSSFALILMDCNMPFMDGYETTLKIRQYLFEMDIDQPIISAVTGHTETQYVKKAIDSGMN